jgi:hypothetical protein
MYPQKDTTDKNVYHALNYSGFSAIAIKAIQEQEKEIDLLKDENRSITLQLIKLQATVELLNQKIGK